MLNSGDSLLQRHATQCISGLCMNQVFMEEMIRCSAISSIVGLLVCDDDETCTFCCITLGRCVARSAVAKIQAKGIGAVQVLVQISAGSREIRATENRDRGKTLGKSGVFGKGGGEEDSDSPSGEIELAPNGLTDELNQALRCTREAAIALGNFATDDEKYILDGSSNFADGRIVSGMLPPGLLRKAPTTHQPSTDFSKVEVVEEEEEVGRGGGGEKMVEDKDKDNDDDDDDDEEFVPNVTQRLSRRTEKDRQSVMGAYIKRQEDLRTQMKRAKLEEEESSEEESDESGSEWETDDDT